MIFRSALLHDDRASLDKLIVWYHFLPRWSCELCPVHLVGMFIIADKREAEVLKQTQLCRALIPQRESRSHKRILCSIDKLLNVHICNDDSDELIVRSHLTYIQSNRDARIGHMSSMNINSLDGNQLEDTE
jgi:hypothetical protein